MVGAALGVTSPNINPVGNYLQAQQAAIASKSAKMQQAEQGVQMLGSMALGVLGGDINGQADPVKWGQAMEMLESQNVDTAAFRDNPGMANTLARASLTAYQQITAAQTDAQLDLALKKYEAELNAGAKPIEVNGQLVDPSTYAVLGDYRTPEAADGETQKDIFGFEKDLWAQYANADPVKTYEVVRGGYERVRESAALDTGAGDMGLIYGYMKMLDPGSVVRESEFAMAAQAGSFGEQIQGMVSRVINGERLPESQRAEFVQAADKLYADVNENLGQFNEQFETRVTGAGVEPSRIIREPETYAPGVAEPKTPEEYAALPPGSQYVDPTGQIRTKQ
jgi:hypothetical protein